jgi:hypothetical protein
MVKLVPVVGTIVLLGAVVQVAFGLQVAGGIENLLGAHMVIGIVGLVLVIALAVTSFKVKTATKYSKLTMSAMTIIVLAQVLMGFTILGGVKALAMLHEATGFLIVLVSLLAGGITFVSAKRHAAVTAEAFRSQTSSH